MNKFPPDMIGPITAKMQEVQDLLKPVLGKVDLVLLLHSRDGGVCRVDILTSVSPEGTTHIIEQALEPQAEETPTGTTIQ